MVPSEVFFLGGAFEILTIAHLVANLEGPDTSCFEKAGTKSLAIRPLRVQSTQIEPKYGVPMVSVFRIVIMVWGRYLMFCYLSVVGMVFKALIPVWYDAWTFWAIHENHAGQGLGTYEPARRLRRLRSPRIGSIV